MFPSQSYPKPTNSLPPIIFTATCSYYSTFQLYKLAYSGHFISTDFVIGGVRTDSNLFQNTSSWNSKEWRGWRLFLKAKLMGHSVDLVVSCKEKQCKKIQFLYIFCYCVIWWMVSIVLMEKSLKINICLYFSILVLICIW